MPPGLLVNYLELLPHHHQPMAWQMIGKLIRWSSSTRLHTLTVSVDSFAMHWRRAGSIGPYYCFAFPEEMVPAAKAVQKHLKSLPGPAAVDAEFAAVKGRRPQTIQPLPAIIPDSLPLGELMRVPPTRRYQRMFRNFEHQQAVREAYDQLNDNKNARVVSGYGEFPNDVDGQHRLVEELYNAILDFSDMDEKQSGCEEA